MSLHQGKQWEKVGLPPSLAKQQRPSASRVWERSTRGLQITLPRRKTALGLKPDMRRQRAAPKTGHLNPRQSVRCSLTPMVRYRLFATVLKVVLRVVPIVENAAIAAIAIREAISAYSIAVTPLSFASNKVRTFN